MIPYEIVITSVHDRGDLLERTLRSMLPRLGQEPERILVHEDARPGQPIVEGRTERILDAIRRDRQVAIELIATRPGTGLGRAILRALEAARTELLLYTQEDFDFVRDVPIARALEIADGHGLNLIRFNKQKTEWCKGEDRPPHERWHAVEVELAGQKLVINDRWCHQPSIWRRSVALAGYRALCSAIPAGRMIDRCEDKFDGWLNREIGKGCACVDGHQDARRELCRTFIWGPIKEPAFVRHTGGERRSQGWAA